MLIIWWSYNNSAFILANMIFVTTFTPADFPKKWNLPEESVKFAKFLTHNIDFLHLYSSNWNAIPSYIIYPHIMLHTGSNQLKTSKMFRLRLLRKSNHTVYGFIPPEIPTPSNNNINISYIYIWYLSVNW